jgi:hypothetical protein
VARPPPGSALGRPPGTGALSRITPQTRQAHSSHGGQQAVIFLGLDCPARGDRVKYLALGVVMPWMMAGPAQPQGDTRSGRWAGETS